MSMSMSLSPVPLPLILVFSIIIYRDHVYDLIIIFCAWKVLSYDST